MLRGLHLRLGLLGWRHCGGGCCCWDCCWASPVAMAAPPLLLSGWCCRDALLLEREVACERECWLCPWLWLSDEEGLAVPGLLWDFSIVGTCVSKTTRFTKLPNKPAANSQALRLKSFGKSVMIFRLIWCHFFPLISKPSTSLYSIGKIEESQGGWDTWRHGNQENGPRGSEKHQAEVKMGAGETDDDRKQTPEGKIYRFLPLAGSGKIPWLRLLVTDDLGESWFSCTEAVVFGEECCDDGLEELCRPWPEWERLWWSPSLCSLRGSHRGMLSSWAVSERLMRTWEQREDKLSKNSIEKCWNKTKRRLPLQGNRWKSPCRSPRRSPPESSSSAATHKKLNTIKTGCSSNFQKAFKNVKIMGDPYSKGKKI